MVAFMIMSSAFASGEAIPELYTCDGSDISPPLEWNFQPSGTMSYAIICDDPDAPVGNWVHWVIYNIPADSLKLEENLPADSRLSDGTLQGKNSWGKIGYGGPCPPGGTHRYFFRIYALDTKLDLEPEATKEELLDAMDGHIIEKAELMGTYTR